MDKEELVIGNNLDICTGTYTRIEGDSVSIVDYMLADQENSHLVSSFLLMRIKCVHKVVIIAC